jgi:hypothetical protein
MQRGGAGGVQSGLIGLVRKQLGVMSEAAPASIDTTSGEKYHACKNYPVQKS